MIPKIILFLLLSLFSNLINAQQHDTLQRAILKELSINVIEKVEVDSSSGIVQNILLSLEKINRFGCLEKQEIFGRDGEIKQVYEYYYLFDTQLQETRFRDINHPNTESITSKFSYYDTKKLKSIKYYNETQLLSVIKFKYSKNGLLVSKKHKLIGNKEKRSKSRKGKTKYIYNADGKIGLAIELENMEGKITKNITTYNYNTAEKTIDKYVKKSPNGQNTLYEKKKFDDKDRMIIHEMFFRANVTLNNSAKSIKILKGESLRIQYIYNNQGLIDKEINSVGEEQKFEIKYIYKS